MGNLEQSLNNNPLAVPMIATATGIWISSLMSDGFVGGICLVALSACIYLLSRKLQETPLRAYRYRNLKYVWISIVFVGIGIMSYSLGKPMILPEEFIGKQTIIKGEIVDVSEKLTGSVILLDANSLRNSDGILRNTGNFKILVRCEDIGMQPVSGDLVTIRTIIKPIEDNPNTFKKGYPRIMASKGILYTCRIKGNDIARIGHISSLHSYAIEFRNSIEAIIENTHLSKKTQNFLIAVMLGDREYLDTEIRNIFSDAGVAHVLALSGMHMGIIGGIFLFMLFPLNFAGMYKVRYLLAAILLWVYALITGMAPATVRACVMVSFASMALALERKRFVFNSLFGASLLILLISPQACFDIGFQLSFVCVASLASFAEHMNPVSLKDHSLIYKTVMIVCATLAATFGSWILAAYYFNQFPITFLPANILLLPLLPSYLVLGFIALFFSHIGMESATLNYVLDKVLEWITDFLSIIGTGNSMNISVSFESIIFWFAGIILLALFLNVSRWRPFMYGAVIAIIMAFITIPADTDNIGNGSFLITNDYNYIKLKIKAADGENECIFPKGKIAGIKIHDKNVISVDCPIPEKITSRNCEYLIIAGGYKGEISEIINTFNPDIIVIHPSVRRKRELQYISEIKKNCIKFHSLRLQKPLKHVRSTHE